MPELMSGDIPNIKGFVPFNRVNAPVVESVEDDVNLTSSPCYF